MKAVLKSLADTLALIVVAPAVLLYGVQASLFGRARAFPGWSQLFALLPGLTGVYLRRAFYRCVLPQCGTGACISFGTVFSHATARVGRNVYVGLYCSLGDVTLEDDVLIASHVSITNGGRQHGADSLDVPMREQAGEYPRVTIGAGAWIGERSVIMADVGRHSIVGAGAVVTKPIGDRVVAVGVPAVVIRERSAPTTRATPAVAAVETAQAPTNARLTATTT